MKKSRRILCIIGVSSVIFLSSCKLPPLSGDTTPTDPCANGQHSIMVENAIAPTCGSPGKTAGVYCSVCDEVLLASTVIPATNQHTVVFVPPVSPTCQDGHTAGSHCSTCGMFLEKPELLAPLYPHQTINLPETSPTCVSPGLTAGTYCVLCHQHLIPQEEIPATGEHTAFVTPGLEPTCSTPGYTAETVCSVCHEILEASQEIPATNDHTPESDPYVDPTCTSAGYTEGSHCSKCNYPTVPQEVIHTLEHSYVDGVCTQCANPQPSEGLKFVLGEDGVSYEVAGVGSCTDKEIIIPSTYQGLPVTKIGKKAFLKNTKITEIIIPNTVTVIEDSAFQKMKELKSVTLPPSVESIGLSAFYQCENLSAVYISDFAAWSDCNIIGLNSTPLAYGALLYLNGTPITDLSILEGITEIGDFAFAGYTHLTNITIPESVKAIGNQAFFKSPSLKTVTFSRGVASIGEKAFSGCTNLTDITFDGCITEVLEDAFSSCTNLKNVNITDIAAWCKCSFATHDTNPLYTPNNDDYVYRYFCINGTTAYDIVIPEGVTYINSYVFSHITISSLTIPTSLEQIKSNAFLGCGPREIYIEDMAAWCNIRFGNAEACPLSWPSSLYCNGKLVTELRVPEGVTKISAYAFYGYKKITAVIFSNSVINVEQYAFGNCINLYSVTIPNSNISIDPLAFAFTPYHEYHYGKG